MMAMATKGFSGGDRNYKQSKNSHPFCRATHIY
jgi:hypothetical protein